MLKELIVKAIRYCRSTKIRKGYNALYRKIDYKYIKSDKEDQWFCKWSKIDKRVSKTSFKIFSTYLNNVDNIENIVPLETAAIYIDPCLNPTRYIPFLNDKNLYDKMFPDILAPRTLFRNIDGFFYDSNYSRIIDVDNDYLFSVLQHYEAVIIKPTLDTGSGKGILIYRKRNGVFMSNGNVLCLEFLYNNYKKDYIIQEVVKQCDFMSFLNYSSVNTIRCMIYRSVKDDKIIFCNSILRIGAKNSDVDNAHSGGVFCGIDGNGKLGKYVCNYIGEKSTVFNGIDFSKRDFNIPQYDKIKDFAIKVVQEIPIMRLIALDIMVNENEEPLLIEYNLDGFSYWLFQFTNGSSFGEYTDEVIEYCQNKNFPYRSYII